ncbi:uridylate kinase [Haematococcus lacustris]
MSTATLSTAVEAEGATPSSVAVKHKIVFVLGGPGSGKGTQCLRLIEEFPNVAHFSAGDLLRDHIKSGTPDGDMVADMIKNGQIVPAQITIGLLQRAMASSGKQRILIDGFPRNQDNRDTFLSMVGYDCSLVLFFDCPEAVLEKRLLARNQGRTDDNIESIKKRFQVFVQQSMPIVESYEKQGKVARINTDRPIDDIYLEVRRLIMEL